MQCPEVQAWQQAQGGPEIESLWRKGILAVSFLVIPLFLLASASPLSAAQKKAKPRAEERQAPPAAIVAPVLPSFNDVNIADHFASGEELLRKGKKDEALRTFAGIYDYAKDVLSLMKCVKSGYDKAAQSQGIDQNTKEELFLKLQKINSLTGRYADLRGESAYRMALIHQAKGNAEQARKLLLEVCQSATFSLEPESIWMKAKEALLSLSHLEGEF